MPTDCLLILAASDGPGRCLSLASQTLQLKLTSYSCSHTTDGTGWSKNVSTSHTSPSWSCSLWSHCSAGFVFVCLLYATLLLKCIVTRRTNRTSWMYNSIPVQIINKKKKTPYLDTNWTNLNLNWKSCRTNRCHGVKIVPRRRHQPPVFIIAVQKHEALVSGVETENPDNLQASRKEKKRKWERKKNQGWKTCCADFFFSPGTRFLWRRCEEIVSDVGSAAGKWRTQGGWVGGKQRDQVRMEEDEGGPGLQGSISRTGWDDVLWCFVAWIAVRGKKETAHTVFPNEGEHGSYSWLM